MAITILAKAAKNSAMLVTFAHVIPTASVLPRDASALESAISALVCEVTRLESRSEFWERWLPWFTALVVAGLLGDAIVIIWERREEQMARRRWVEHGFHPAEISPTWKFVLELVATAAIFVGVGLELWAGAAVASINGQLRPKNTELRNTGDELVALLHHEVEDERLARVKIEASVAWRHLTKQQKTDIGEDLRKTYKPELISMWFLHGDAEGANFAADIANALKNAKMLVFPPLGAAPSPPSPNNVQPGQSFRPWPTGVRVEFREYKQDAKSVSEAIAKELNDRGFNATSGVSEALKTDDPPKSPDILVLIFSRPEGPQGEYKLQAEQETKAKNANNTRE